MVGGPSSGDLSCEHLIWILSPQGHRCSSPHHQCSHLWGQTGSHSRGCGNRERHHALHDSQQSGSSGSAGTSGRVGASFCPETLPSQLVVERGGHPRGGAGRPTCLLCTASLHFDAHPVHPSPNFLLSLTKIDRFLTARAQ